MKTENMLVWIDGPPREDDRDDRRPVYRRWSAIALCCDLRLASTGSKFGSPATWLGAGYGAPA